MPRSKRAAEKVLDRRSEPEASRPHVPGYGIPARVKGVLPWSHVNERLEKARNLWVVTAGPNGEPHAVPVWGVWVEGTVCVGGGETRWSRNLNANPRVAVHLESGDDVVILEGTAERIGDPTHPLVKRVSDAYHAKYGMRHPPPFWTVRPRVVFAWSAFPKNATRWVFAPE